MSTSEVTWQTDAHSAGNDLTANALRWGTLYNFRFDVASPPAVGDIVIDLFRPGSPSQMPVRVVVPTNTDCGDTVCEVGEDSCLCEADCGAPPAAELACEDGVDGDCDGQIDCADSDCSAVLACLCGNGVCDAGEDCGSCATDCISGSGGDSCGNGVCEPLTGEDCGSCDADCNGRQNGKPTNRFCCGDGDGQAAVSCADGRCTESGWACDDAATGTYCCGDLVCEAPEDSLVCQVDCGPPPTCGDGSCDAGEDSCGCPSDCGAPPANESALCSDGIDNDCDGDIDAADADCAGVCVPTANKEKGPRRCSNGLDDDCDGLIDGSDPDC